MVDKMIGKLVKDGEQVAPVKSIKVKFQKADYDKKKKELAKKHK